MIEYFPPINTVLLVVVIAVGLLIERKLAYIGPIRAFTLLEDLERLRTQQITTDNELAKIRDMIQQTVSKLTTIDHAIEEKKCGRNG